MTQFTAGNTEKILHDEELGNKEKVYNFPPLAQSLVRLFALFGKQISVCALTGGRLSNFPVAEALRLSRENGFEAKLLKRRGLDSISSLTLPCILILKNSESCVLTEINQATCTVYLPLYEKKEIELPREKLEEEYTGYALFLALPKIEDYRTSSIHLLEEKRWFWDVIWHYIPIYKHVLFASILINCIAIASSLFSMNVYDRVVPNHAIDTLWGLAIGLLIAYLCDFILKNIRSYFVDVAGRNADVILSSKLVSKILSMRYSDKSDSVGVLANNIREFESLREFFSSSTLVSLIDIPFLVLFLLLVLYIGGSMVFIPLIAIPILLLFSYILQKYSVLYIERNFKQNMQKNALLIEILNGLETIKCCSAEKNMQHNWEEMVGICAQAGSNTRTISSFIGIFSGAITQLVSLSVIIWGVYLISDAKLTMGGLIACNILVGRAMVPLTQMAGIITRFQQARMTLKSLDILMKKPSERANTSLYLGANVKADITFEEVDFAYPNALHSSLKNINLQIKQGERVGIIGKMASGKSTFAKLLTGLYQPTKGYIAMDNTDLRQLDPRDLRAHIGFLPQDIILFYGSIRDNIALSDTQVDDKEIYRVAELAGVMDFAKRNPLGLSALVGERGMNFSGGQRQAIALARALLQQPEVIILDEPSSNMDIYSEEILKQRLREIVGRASLIVITHRLSMLDIVDRLIILDEGKIIADGAKEDIIQRVKSTNSLS